MQSFDVAKYMDHTQCGLLQAVDDVSKALTSRNAVPAFLFAWCNSRFQYPADRTALLLSRRLRGHGWPLVQQVVSCDVCHGTGSIDHECYWCEGTGMMDETLDFVKLKKPQKCTQCKGTGRDSDKCRICDGQKTVNRWLFDRSVKPVPTEGW